MQLWGSWALSVFRETVSGRRAFQPHARIDFMSVMVVGGSKGLGRAIVEGLRSDGYAVTGVSRNAPNGLEAPWITADFSDPAHAVKTLSELCPAGLDTLIWNLGVWEPTAFTEAYRFDAVPDSVTSELIATNITAPILAIRALMPRLLLSNSPRVILTGSTSALRQSGRPEVAFGASKTALNGIADALREGYRNEGLRVTTLQLGDLNTEDGFGVPVEDAAEHGAGTLIPVHDVVAMIRSLLSLSSASFVREIIMPALHDPNF